MRRAARRSSVLMVVAGFALLSGCGSDEGAGGATDTVVADGMAIVDAWARPTAPGIDTGAIYLTVENRSAPDDRIVAAASARCATVVPHLTVVDDAGVASMPGILGDELHLPTGATVAMAPMGLHLMCLGLGAPLEEGATLDVTLDFDLHAPMTVTVAVENR